MANEFDGAHVLVTGGSGFIGRTVVRVLAREGARVRVADRLPYHEVAVAGGEDGWAAGVEALTGELGDPEFREEAVTADLDAVVHLAASPFAVVASLRDPLSVYADNVTVTAELLELTRARGIGRFFMTSSNAAVGDVGDRAIHEDLPLRPLSPYGASKAAGEMLLSGYAGGFGMAACALRLTNVYGPGMAHKDSFVPRLMRAALSGDTVTVYGDGTQRRDLVHVEDVARGLLTAWRAGHVGPVIIGSGRSVSVLEIIEAARRATGCELPVEHGPRRGEEMPAVVVDIGRARGIGYVPRVGLDEGMRTVWADFRAAARRGGAAGGAFGRGVSATDGAALSRTTP